MEAKSEQKEDVKMEEDKKNESSSQSGSSDEESSGESSGSGEESSGEEEEGETRLKFRNYVPKDPKLRERCLARKRLPPIEADIGAYLKLANEDMLMDATLQDLAPKAANWDLKRDLEPSMKKLERKTQEAIVEILKTTVD